MALTSKPFCANCGTQMIFDDCDFNFKGNKDNYWFCPNCLSTAITRIRYGQILDRVYCNEQGDRIKYERNADFKVV